MRSVGSYLKEARLKKKLSLKLLERETKIKKSFIDNIEKSEWNHLPEYSVTSGFVKTIAKYLDVPEENALAIFRRDYPVDTKKISINPKPDLKLRSFISPKIFMVAFSILAGIFFLAYLSYQYILYISPPKISVISPTEGEVVNTDQINVSGKTDSDATLTVNNQKILISEDGNFTDMIEVDINTREIVFVARSRYGKETVVIRRIIPKLK